MTDLPAAIIPETVPAEWVQAARAHYSMHGAGLTRNIIAAVAPHITAAATAAERDRIIGLASQLRAVIPADHPEGAQASFADYLRVTRAQDMREALGFPPLPADAP